MKSENKKTQIARFLNKQLHKLSKEHSIFKRLTLR